MKSGIYKITNTLNNHCYIGSAVNINRRFITHRYRLNDQTHHSSYFQNAWNKYGSEAFIYEVLLYCSKEDLIFYEQRAIDIYKPEYNMCPTAGSSLGRKLTEEHKAKISASGKGKIKSEETRKKLSKAKTGTKMSQEAKDRMSQAKKGKKMKNPRTPEACAILSKALMGHVLSQETKDKISEKAKQRTGEKNPMFGKTHSEETKKKIAEKARNISDETREKQSRAHKGHICSEEHKQKVSEATKGEKNPIYGKPRSQETKDRISAAKKAGFLLRKLQKEKKLLAPSLDETPTT